MKTYSSWSIALAVVVLGVTLPNAGALAATIIKAKRGNDTLATAQPIDLTPDLVVKQKKPNDTVGTAQPVSPTYMAADVFGSLTKRQSQAFFSFPIASNKFIHLRVAAKYPTTQFTELFLYDAAQNLVAIASGTDADGISSVIDFQIPGGMGGDWTAEVVGGPLNQPGFSYDLAIQGATGVGPVIPR